MMHKMRLLKRSTIVAVILALLFSSVAAAITIVVDGVREAAWNAAGTAADGNEIPITNDGVDISRVQWTNNTSNFFLLIETYANTDWNFGITAHPFVTFCMNTDNNTATGSTNPGVCLGSGYDRYIKVAGPTPLTMQVTDSAGVPIAATTQVATAGTITELSINVAALGLSTLNCGTMPTGVYFDGATTAPDDNVLDNADIQMTCGTPTAITLSSVTARSETENLALLIAAGVLGVSVVALVTIIARRRKGQVS